MKTSIAFYYSLFFSLLTNEVHNGISILTITKPQFYPQILQLQVFWVN